jgi:phospholipase/lecithinase/hemolysin
MTLPSSSPAVPSFPHDRAPTEAHVPGLSRRWIRRITGGLSARCASGLSGSVAALGLALALAPAQALAVPSFSQIVVFGDSLSDTGNTQAVLGTFAPIANAAGYGANGRFSNGPVWHEPLAQGLGLSPATRSRSGGSNYAHGGARVDNATGASEGVLTQFNSYINGPAAGGADGDALFLLWAGGNDARDLVGNASPEAGVASSIAALGTVLTGLIDAGATTLLVPNLPDLGRIPENLGTANQASASFVTGLWNDALLSMVSGVALQNTVAIYYLDVFSTFNAVLDDPGAFGFVNTTGQCRSVTNFGFTELSCAQPDTWVFWDAIHPTRAAHALVGAAAFELLATGAPLPAIPEAATWAQLVLGLGLLGFWVGRARRGRPTARWSRV